MAIQAIGGVRVKIFILSYLKELLGGTKAFYRMSKSIFVQKLLHFEVRNFGRISYKKMGKFGDEFAFSEKMSTLGGN